MLDGQTSQSQDTMMEADWRTSLLWDLITVLLSLWKAWSCTASSDGALRATAVFPGSKPTVADEDSHLGQHAAWVFFTLPMPLNRWHGTPSSFSTLSFTSLRCSSCYQGFLFSAHHIVIYTHWGPCRFLPDLICHSCPSPQWTRKGHRFSRQGCLSSPLTPPSSVLHHNCHCHHILVHNRLCSTLPHISAFLFHIKMSHCSSFWPLLNFSNAIIESEVWRKWKTILWRLYYSIPYYISDDQQTFKSAQFSSVLFI